MFYFYPYLVKSTIFQMGWNHQVYSLYVSSGNLSWLEIASFPNRKHLFKRSMCCCCVWMPRGYVCVSLYIHIIHIICIYIYTEMLFLSGCSNHDIGPSEATGYFLLVPLGSHPPPAHVFQDFSSHHPYTFAWRYGIWQKKSDELNNHPKKSINIQYVPCVTEKVIS